MPRPGSKAGGERLNSVSRVALGGTNGLGRPKGSPDGEFQVAEKVEVQEAVPPAGVLGAEPLSLMPQHFPREPAKRCFQATAAIRFFSTV